MTECRGRYIVTVGNVIHGVFPKSSEYPMIAKSDFIPCEVFYDAEPTQMELDLTGSYSTQSRPREDMSQIR